MVKHMFMIMMLRWRMFQNSASRSKYQRMGSFLVGCVQVVVLLAALAFGVGAYFAGKALSADGLGQGSMIVLTLVIDGVLFYLLLIQLMGVMMQIQRDEPIDFYRLLYLPIPLRTVFLLNFGMSLFSLGMPFYMLGLMGFCLGLSMQLGALVLLGIPIGIMMYMLVAAWSYYMQGALMFALKTKRKRHMAMMAISMVFMIPSIGIYMVPTLAFNHTMLSKFIGASMVEYPELEFEDEASTLAYMKSIKELEDAQEDAVLATVNYYLRAVNSLFPLGWFPLGITALAEGQWGLALLCFLGLTLICGAGLYYGYHSTLRQYVSGGNRGSPQPGRAKDRSSKTFGQRVINWRIPLFSDTTSAVAYSAFLTQLRHPIMWNLIMFPVMIGIFIVLPTRNYLNEFSGTFSFMGGDMLVHVAVLVPFYSGVMLFQACFGFDTGMVRAYILLPGERKQYLLGLNLAASMLLGSIVCALLGLMYIFMGIGLSTVFIAVCQLVYVCVVYSILGNLIAIRFPYKIPQKGNDMKAGSLMIQMFMTIGMMLVLGSMFIPVMVYKVLDVYLISFKGYEGPSSGIFIVGLCALVALIMYRVLLPTMGRLLEKHEQQILDSLLKQEA